MGGNIEKDAGFLEQDVIFFFSFLCVCVCVCVSCGSADKESPAMRETWVQSLVWEDPLEKGKATHSSILAWRIPWTV